MYKRANKLIYDQWFKTDDDTGQYGKQLSKKVFLFKEKGVEETIIDLTKFTDEQIENWIKSYGYTLGESKKKMNIVEQYGEMSNWIIAECIFESTIF